MLPFFLGLILGGSAGWLIYLSSRREIRAIDEEKQMLSQEKHIVLDFMHNMVEAVGEGIDREELFQRVVHAAILSTGALSACVFELTDENKLRGVAVEGLFPPQRPLNQASRLNVTTRAKFIEQILRSEELALGEGLIGMVAKGRQGVLIPDGRVDPRVVKHDDPALEIRSIIVAPILFRDRLLGILAVANPTDGLAFTETDFSLVQSLSEQSGLAIHNSDVMAFKIEKNKLDHDLALAHNIQGMLLPRQFPETGFLDIDAVYMPAQQVGGDLYDVFELPEDKIGVAIADVSGKGIPASLLMAICQVNLRHFARQHEAPSSVLSELNRVMTRDMRRDMFITIIYAVIDLKANEVVFARAGHELPLIFYTEHQTEMFQLRPAQSDGMAVGMVPPELFNTIIEDKKIPFEPGDIMVLYTDGVTEAENASGTEYSTARLADTIKSMREKGAQELNEGIIESVKRFSQKGPQGDDITLVTVKRT